MGSGKGGAHRGIVATPNGSRIRLLSLRVNHECDLRISECDGDSDYFPCHFISGTEVAVSVC